MRQFIMKVNAMKNIVFLPVLFLCYCTSSTEENNTQNEVFPYEESFDTALVIQYLDLIELNSILNDAVLLENEDFYPLDTFILTYSFCACGTWPNWLNEEYLNDPDYQKDFIAEHWQIFTNCNDPWFLADTSETDHQARYYVEPAGSSLEIPWSQIYPGNKIRFIGQLKKYTELPNEEDGYMGNPPKALKLIYYKYEMVSPFKVYGPERFAGYTGINDEDSAFLRSVITIKK